MKSSTDSNELDNKWRRGVPVIPKFKTHRARIRVEDKAETKSESEIRSQDIKYLDSSNIVGDNIKFSCQKVTEDNVIHNIINPNPPLWSLKNIFPHYFKNGDILNDDDFRNLKLTTTSEYSTSKCAGSYFLSEIIKGLYNDELLYNSISIIDACANVGSDTIRLGLEFGSVSAIELDTVNFEVLENNVNVYGLDDSIRIYNNNALDKIHELDKHNILYVDAPWGGRTYNEYQCVRLFLGDKEISEMYNIFKDKCDYMIFKVPYNYDYTNFIHNVKSSCINIYKYIVNCENKDKQIYRKCISFVLLVAKVI